MFSNKQAESNFIKSLYIENFRNHKSLEIQASKSSIVIHGENGTGKTSILEALSIFSYGKGLRNSKFLEMIKKDQEMFCVSISIQGENKILSELKSIYNKNTKSRQIYVNGKEKKNLKQLRQGFPMLWITPYDEKIFTGSSTSRRAFFDRLVANFDVSHNLRINSYNKLLQQRSKILKNRNQDISWLDAIEDQLSKLAVSICSSRLDILGRLSGFLSMKIKGFPNLRIDFSESIENNLYSEPAVRVEEKLKLKYMESREIDLLLGGSMHGCHKTELLCYNLEKNMPADMCSSGEQKLLLVTIILSCAKALKKSFKISPIMLLDEIFTHLDQIKRSLLFKELMSLGSQLWITTTETDNFFKKYDNVYYYELKNLNIKDEQKN